MKTNHLVDPELLPALQLIPPFGDIAQTLGPVRAAIAGTQVPSQPAPLTSVREQVILGVDGEGDVRVLVISPVGQAPSGVLLWFHGGGMVMGEPGQNEPLGRYIAQHSGSLVIAVGYRLAPENPYPAAINDAYAALRWAHETADEMGISPSRIAVGGESGGAGIAAGLALLARDRGELSISGQFLLYPMLDDRTGSAAELEPIPTTGEFIWNRQSNRFAWDALLDHRAGEGDTPIYAAPARAEDLTGVAPASIFVGSLDLFVGEDIRFAHHLIRDGVTAELHVYPGAFHGFVSFAQDADISKRAFRDFSTAIERHFA